MIDFWFRIKSRVYGIVSHPPPGTILSMVIVTLKGGGSFVTLIFEISIARAQKDINSMQVQ